MQAGPYVETVLPELLCERSMTQQALADATGIDRITINGYCRGRRPLGTKNAMRIAKALEVPLDVLVTVPPQPSLRLESIEQRLIALEQLLPGSPRAAQTRDSIELAGDVADYLNEHVLSPGETVSVLDLLDALASSGIRLVDDPGGESTGAYWQAVDGAGD